MRGPETDLFGGAPEIEMARGVNRIGDTTRPDPGSGSLADRVGVVSQALVRSFHPHGIVTPEIKSGADGYPCLLWRQSEHRLEFLSDPNETSPFFYKNAQTGWMWEAEWDPARPIPSKVREALRACGAIEPKFSSPRQLLERLDQPP